MYFILPSILAANCCLHWMVVFLQCMLVDIVRVKLVMCGVIWVKYSKMHIKKSNSAIVVLVL